MEKTINVSNKSLKVITALLGIFTFLCGIHCISTPLLTFMALTQIIGIITITAGAARIFYYTRNNTSEAHWDLLSGSFELLTGVLMISNFYANFLTTLLLTSLVAVWLLIRGFEGIYFALNLKKFDAELPKEYRSHLWMFILIMGILTTLLGIMCVLSPMFSMMSIGFLIGTAILFIGIQTLILSFCIL